jgi:regulatory protein
MDTTDAETAAVRLLARRDHSKGELKGKLRERGFEDNAIDEVLAVFEQRGWLDDKAFAERQAMLLAEQEFGPVKIVQKLVLHGVPQTLARSAVDGLDLEQTWSSIAQARIRKKFGRTLDEAHKAKAFRHLVQRGFTPSVARGVVFAKAGVDTCVDDDE